MVTPKEDVLDFEVAVDIRNSLKAMEKFQRQMAKVMKTVAKSGKKMGDEAAKGSRKAKQETDDWSESVKGLGDAYDKGGTKADNLSETIAELANRIKTMSGEEKKAAKAQLASLKKVATERKKLGGGSGTTAPKGGLFFGRFSPEKVRKELSEAGQDLVEPLQAFLQRDLKGIVSGSMKGAGSVFSRSIKLTKALSEVGSAAFSKKGEQVATKGKAKGGAQGAVLALAGGGMKKIGDMMGKMGGLINTLATIGPLLGTAANAVVGLIKLFIDADAMVKDFNRGIMESASNLEFLEHAGWSANGAIMNMRDTLDGVRAAAMDGPFNNALGITKDTHTAILNTLTQEGVAMGNLAAEAGNTQEGMKKLTQSIVTTGVAYSRSLGVPIQEITTLQAEMAVEMGNAIEDTKNSFANMTRAAAASGIAGNKFFSIIRAASADLSLWNLRLDGAVDLLGKLGKIMSPRAAQSFFQSVSQGFKNMGRQDLLKQTLMAGVENVRDVLNKDIGAGQAELAKQIIAAGGAEGQSLERVVEQLRDGGYGAADQLIRGVTDKSKIGTLRNKAAEIERKSQGAKGGTFEVAQASGEIQGIGGQLSVLMRAVESMGGSLLKPNKMALAQTAENLGVSQEQVRQLHSLALAVDAQKKIMLKDGKYSPEQIAKMTWEEIIATDESLQSQSDKLQQEQTAAQQTVQQAVETMSKEQGQRTQTLTDKLDNLVNWFMNTFYNLMIDIWDAIMSLPGVGGGATSKQKRAIYKSGNADLIQAFDKALDGSGALDFGKFKGNAVGGALGGRLNELSGTEAGRQTIASSVQSNFSGNEVLDMAKASGLSADKQAALQKKLERQRYTARINYGSPMGGVDQVSSTGIAGKGELGDLLATFKEIGLSAEEQANLLGKAGWSASSVDGLAALAKDLGKGSSRTATTPPAEATADGIEASNAHLEAISADNQKLQTTVAQTGIKIAPPTLKEEAKGMEASMLSALRTALFEYYMYSGTSRGTLLTMMKQGGVADPRSMASYFGAKSVASGSTLGAVEGLGTGEARAQGEGLASAGRGGGTVAVGPGAGAGGVNVVVNGIGGQDLARFIEGKVVEGIREYKRREKFY